MVEQQSSGKNQRLSQFFSAHIREIMIWRRRSRNRKEDWMKVNSKPPLFLCTVCAVCVALIKLNYGSINETFDKWNDDKSLNFNESWSFLASQLALLTFFVVWQPKPIQINHLRLLVIYNLLTFTFFKRLSSRYLLPSIRSTSISASPTIREGHQTDSFGL